MTEGHDQNGGKEEPLEHAVERLEHAEADLARAREEEARAEHEIEEAVEDIERVEHQKRSYELIVNRKPHTWPDEEIDGSQIKTLAGSPSDWVVNQNIDGPGEDPEIGNNQRVHLALDAEPKGIKRFTTRKPKTSPGAQ
jgi:Multiubiquitin